MKYNFIVRITKIHSVKDHIAPHFYIINTAVCLMYMLPRPAPGSLSALNELSILLSDIHKRNITFIRFLLFIQQLKNTLCSCHSHNNCIYLLAHLIDWHTEAFIKSQKACQTPQRKPTYMVQRKNSSRNCTDYIAYISQLRINRSQKIGKCIRSVCTDIQSIIQFPKSFFILFFMAEYFYYLLSGHHLFDISIHCPQILLLLHKISAASSCGSPGRQYHNANHQQRYHCQRHIQNQHTDKYTDNGKCTVSHLRNTLADHLSQSINIIGINRHDIPMSVGIKVFNRKFLHMRKQIVPQIPQYSLCNIYHNPVICVSSADSHCIKTRYSGNRTGKR